MLLILLMVFMGSLALPVSTQPVPGGATGYVTLNGQAVSGATVTGPGGSTTKTYSDGFYQLDVTVPEGGSPTGTMSVTLPNGMQMTVPSMNFTSYPSYRFNLTSSTTSYNISLIQGWNFVSSPQTITPFKASTINNLSSQGGIQDVMWYNSSSMSYQAFVIGVSPSRYDFNITNDAGYLVYATKPTNLTFSGSTPGARSIILNNSWNMVGWSTYNSSDADAVCKRLAGNQQVMMYDAPNQTYKAYVEGVSPLRYNFAMTPGSGYLIYSSNVTTLNYGGF